MRETPIGIGLSAASAECGTQVASQPIHAVCVGMRSAGSPNPRPAPPADRRLCVAPHELHCSPST
jgi:hypothetical protein